MSMSISRVESVMRPTNYLSRNAKKKDEERPNRENKGNSNKPNRGFSFEEVLGYQERTCAAKYI